MNSQRRSEKGIYKYFFFGLLFLNVVIAIFLCYKYPRVFNVFQNQIDNLIENYQNFEGDYLKGIDVSEYQGIINWNQIKKAQASDSLSFVVLRATAGKDHRDRYFTSNYREAKKLNIPVGVYHYYRPNESSEQQAEFFIDNVKLSSGDLPPILDIENTSDVQSIDKLKKGVANWLKIIEAHYGVEPILYSYSYFYKTYLNEDFSAYKLWIANYSNVKDPLPSKKWMFWQFSEKGRVKGIKGPVDLDVFKGEPKELKSILLK